MRKEEFGIMRWLDMLTTLLLVLGGLLWGVGSLLGYEMITSSLVNLGWVGRGLFFLIGLSALYEIVGWRVILRRWHCSVPLSEAQSPAT